MNSRPSLLRFEWHGERCLMTLEFDRASGRPVGYMIACPLCARRLLLITESLSSDRPRRFVLQLGMSERPSLYPAVHCPDCHWTAQLEDGFALPLPTRSLNA